MKRTIRVLALLAMAGAGAVALAQDKPPSIKEVMARLNKPGGLYPTISKALKADTPDWDEIRLEAKTFVKLADALGKDTPPAGDASSWAKLTKAYADHARALEDAADKKDRAAANTARAGLGGETCKSCHSAHKKQ
jgi:hypothetical protein